MRPLCIALSLLWCSACQSRTEMHLEQARAELVDDAQNGRVPWFMNRYEEIDREMRLDRGRINGKPSTEARAEFRSWALDLLRKNWPAEPRFCIDKSNAVAAALSDDPDLMTRWNELLAHCRQLDDQYSRESAEREEKNRQRRLAEAPDHFLVFIDDTVTPGLVDCLNISLRKGLRRSFTIITRKEFEKEAPDFRAALLAASPGLVTISAEQQHTTLEIQNVRQLKLVGVPIAETGRETVGTKDVLSGLTVTVSLERKGQPLQRVTAAYKTPRFGDSELHPTRIKDDVDLSDQTCPELQKALATLTP